MAVLLGKGVTNLNTRAGVDAKVVASTILYTVPAGKTAIIHGITVRCTAASGISAGATAQVEVAPTSGDIFGSQTWAGVHAQHDRWDYAAGGKSKVITAGQNLLLNITAGATGTSQTMSVDIVGHLV